MKFNLEHFLTKEAMAYAWRYRSGIRWCRLEDAIRGDAIVLDASPNQEGEDQGQDGQAKEEEITWSQLKAKESNGVRNSLFEILKFKIDKDRLFTARYGFSREELEDNFQVFVGYNTQYGLYMCSIGPYTASPTSWAIVRKALNGGSINDESLDELINTNAEDYVINAARGIKADKNNRYGFFSKRYQKATQKEIQASCKRYANKLVKKLSEYMDTSEISLSERDMQLVLTKATGNLRGTETLENDRKVFPGLDETSPYAKNLYKDMPVLGVNSEIELRPNILAKIIKASVKQGNWQKVYDEAIRRIAIKSVFSIKRQRGALPEIKETDRPRIEAESARINAALDDENFDGSGIINQILSMAEEIRKEFATQDPTVADMRIPPLKVMKGQAASTQMPTTLGIKPSQVHQMELRSEILNTIVEIGSDDPKKVMQALSSSAKRAKIGNILAKGNLSEESIMQFILRCKQEHVGRGKNGKFQKRYDALAEQALKQLDDTRKAVGKRDMEGFDNLEETFMQASIFFNSPGADAVDPGTKADITSFMMPVDLFKRGKNNKNYKSVDLTSKRRGEAEEVQALENIPVVSPKEKEIEIGVRAEESISPQDEEVTPEEVNALPEDPEETGEVAATEETPATPTEQPVDFPIEDLDQQTQPTGTLVDFPVTEVPQQTITPEPTPVDQSFPIEETPAAEPVINTTPKPTSRPKKKKVDVKKLVSGSLENLIKLARDLDYKGKYDASEEIHKIIRKYQKGL